MADQNPFSEFGGELKSKTTENPFAEFGGELKKKESTPSGFSVTPLPSQDKFQQGLAMAKSPIASAVKKDTQKDESLAAGIYNTLVGSVKRLAGGAAYMAEVGGLISGGRPEFAITRLANAENVRQKTEQFVEKARSEKASKQYEESMGKYDFTPKPGGGLLSGVDADDFKALAFTAPSQALDMVLGSLTYGSSFVAQSVSDAANEINQSDSGKKLNDAQKAAYIFTQAAVQAALEKVSLDLILKNTGLGKVAKQKIANEVAEEFVKRGIKATAKDIEEVAIKKASTFANKVKRVGFKTASGIAAEGTTEGTQTAAQEGIKLLTNKIVDKDVFDEEDIIANLGKNIINASVGGAAFGGVAGGGVGVFQNTNKAIRNEVAKAGKKYFVNNTEVSEAEFNVATGNKKVVSDITNIQQEISKQVEEGNITPQEAEAANITAQQYAEIAGKIPTTVSPQDKYKIIGGIEQREALNARKQQAYDELTNLDPVFRKEKQDQIDLIQAKIDETNDYLEGIVSGKKPQYKEKRGMYFKVDSEGQETPISKETYDLAKSIREEDERKAKEPVDTTPAVIMPEENVAPEVVEPTRPAVIMPEENVPAETTVISPEQQAKGAAVVMPEANVAPEVAETVVTEEVKPTEVKVKPEVKSKLQDYKQKFSSIDLLKSPTKKSIDTFIQGYDFNKGKLSYENIKEAPSGLSDQEIKKFNVENSTNPKELVEIYLSEPKESKLTPKEEVIAEGLSKVTLDSFKRFGDKNLITGGMARTYFNKRAKGIDVRAEELSEELEITPKDIVDFMVKYPSGASAALRSGESDVAYAAAMKFQDLTGLSLSDRIAKKVFEKGQAPKEKTKIEFDVEEDMPAQLEGGFVPFVEGEEELPFAVQEATTEEVAAMQDIVKDYIDDGATSLSEIKKAIAKELGYNTKKLRQTIENAFNEYTTTAEAAVTEVKSGLLGRVGNAFGKMFGKETQKPFIAKDGKALSAKAKNVAETGGRVSFQATLPSGEKVTAKPVDASVVNGFYSPLELQINQMKQDKMPAKQWLDKLRGEEAKWTGLSDWLSQQEGSLTKENIKNWLQDNQIQINEIIKGTPDVNDKSLWEYRASGDGVWTYSFKGGSFIIDASEGDNNARIYIVDSGGANEVGLINYSDRDQILDMALERNTFENYIDDFDLNTTKYSKYTLDGEKQDYKEILITYPTQPSDITFEQWNKNRESWGTEKGTLEEFKKQGVLYKSSHFDEKNILVHVRSDIRTDSKGNKIFFIEEVQSDWGQEGKKKGFFEDFSLKDIQRHQELMPIIKKLDETEQDIREASIYMNGGSRSQEALDISKFLSLSKDERKSKIELIHNQKQSIEYNIINSLQKDIDKNNKEVSEKIDQELALEKELNKYDKFLETTKSNREFNQANEEWNTIFKEIRKLKSEQQNLEEFTLGLEKEIKKANERIGVDNFYYQKSLKTSEVDFDKVEYIKIKNEYTQLNDKIISVKLQKAPFVTKTNDWAKLGLKVALKNAVESGATKIAWTNGEQQNERYDLSKEVDYIRRIEKDENTFYLDISLPRGMINLVVDNNGIIESQKGSMLSNVGSYVGKSLSDLIGKDVADRVLSNGDKTYAGENLKIGGKGMIGFYGSPKNGSFGILGDLAKSLYKQTPEKIILDNYREEKLKSLQAELDENTANKTSDFRMRDFHLNEAANETDPEEKQYNLTQADYYDKRGKNSAELEESVLREIKRLGVEYQYSINITPELKAQVEVGLPLFMANQSGADILGFSFANRMYLNGEKLNPNTIIHEAGHIWTEWVKNNDYNIYAKGMELVEKSPYLQKAKNSKFYQEQAAKLGTEQEKEEYFKHEALAMAIGDKGAQFVVESKKDAFKDWLKTLWNKIKSLTGFKDLTEEQFQNLTFEEFSKMAVKEILGVENDLDKFQAARSMKKKKEFVKSKVRGEANKKAIDDFEVDDMIKLIKADYDLQTLKNIKDAIQKRSAEEVLPSKPSKVREPRGERKRVEPGVEGDETAGESEAAPAEGVEKEWQGAITIAANEERRQLLGLPEYQRERESFEQWTNDAIKAIKRGYDVEKLLDKMAKGYSPTPVENQIRKIYVAKLKSDYDKNPSTELEKKLINYTELNDLANSAAGRQLRSLADVTEPRETLADFVLAKMKAQGVGELTENQRADVEKKFNEIKKKEIEVDAKFNINDKLNTELLAENTFQQIKKERKPYQKTRDYKSERKSVIDEIKRKWKENDKPTDVVLALPVPFPTKKAQQLYAIAPDVNKLMKLYIEEGVDTLAEVVSKIYVDLRNEVDDLIEKDIFDIIAGRYTKQKQTLNSIQAKKIDLKREAQLISEIENLLSGKMPTNEKAKIEQNQKIIELRNQLKNLKKDLGVYDLAKIESLKQKNIKQTQELDEKIKAGNFEKELKPLSFLENPEFRKKYPQQFDEYYDAKEEYLDKKYEFDVLLLKDQMSKSNLSEKIYKKYIPLVNNTFKAILTTLDNSYIFVQLYPEIMANPLLLPKILNEQRKVIFNEGRFKREIAALHEDKELWNIIQKSELDILDPRAFKEKLKDESMGATNLLEIELKIGDKKIIPSKYINAPFERIATTAGNFVRTKAFLEIVAELESQGKTIENSEKLYKDYARVLNEMSGRGKLPSAIENQSGIVSAFVWAPRMLASSFNILGIGDFVNFFLGKKGYYRSLDKEARNFALKRMGRAVGFASLIMLGFSLNDDYEVDYDPHSTSFGTIKNKKTNVSDNVFGRLAPVFRFFIIMLPYMGYKTIKGEPIRVDYLEENYKFLRGKAAPGPGVLADLYMRENLKGDPVEFSDLPKELLTPMSVKEIIAALEEEGVPGIFRAIRAIHGSKITTEKMFNQAKKPLEDLYKKHARTEDDVRPYELKNPYTGEKATEVQYDQYVKERDRLIKQNLKNLYNNYVITDSPNPVPFVSLEAKEASEEITKIKTKSTKEAKEIVFGKKKQTPAQKIAEAKKEAAKRILEMRKMFRR